MLKKFMKKAFTVAILYPTSVFSQGEIVICQAQCSTAENMQSCISECSMNAMYNNCLMQASSCPQTCVNIPSPSFGDTAGSMAAGAAMSACFAGCSARLEMCNAFLHKKAE